MCYYCLFLNKYQDHRNQFSFPYSDFIRMIQIKINGQTIEVQEGTTVIKAAKMAGVTVPSLCYNEELGHFTSCMLCLVKDAANGRLIPSCSVTATDGMSIITDDDEIKEARQTGLELLLSEHVGDCEAPCPLR